MSFMNEITRTSATILLLASAVAADDTGAHPLRLQCEGQDRLEMCQALAKALAPTFKGYSIEHVEGSAEDPMTEAALTLHYEEHGRADSWMSGQLSWSSADGRKGHSPILEFSVMDRQLGPKDFVSFAQQLIRTTNIPSRF